MVRVEIQIIFGKCCLGCELVFNSVSIGFLGINLTFLVDTKICPLCGALWEHRTPTTHTPSRKRNGPWQRITEEPLCNAAMVARTGSTAADGCIMVPSPHGLQREERIMTLNCRAPVKIPHMLFCWVYFLTTVSWPAFPHHYGL